MTDNLPDLLTDFYTADHWLVQVCAVLFVTLLATFVEKKYLNRLYDRLKNTSTHWDDAFLEALRKPLLFFIWLIGLSILLEIIQSRTSLNIVKSIGSVRELFIIIILAWFLLRFIRISEQHVIEQQRSQNEHFDQTTFDAIAKLLRLCVIIITTLVILQTLGFSISGILAFGGIGGIAIGFAAKDLLANFFGGLMIFLDRPFNVGDWIRTPDRDFEGTVEHIGWRLTRIRTFDKRPLYIPNATFSTIAVENPSRMFNRRIKETIGIRYQDASKIAPIIEQVKTMLMEHQDIDQSQTLIVNFNTFASSSMEFFIYTFTRTTDWIKYHEVKQDVLLKVLAIIENNGAECAFPTSTLYLKNDVLSPPA